MRDAENALEIEVSALADACFAHLVQHPEDLQRFMAEVGYSPDSIGKAVGTRAFNLAMIEYFVRSEPLLLVLCANSGLSPARVSGLWQKLTGEV